MRFETDLKSALAIRQYRSTRLRISMGNSVSRTLVVFLTFGCCCAPDVIFDNPCDPSISPESYFPCDEKCDRPDFTECHEETDGTNKYPVYKCISNVFFCEAANDCEWKTDWCNEGLQLCCPDGWTCSPSGKCCELKCFETFECDHDPCGIYCGECDQTKGFECVHEIDEETEMTLSTRCIRM